MDPISKLFIAAGLVVVGLLIAISVIVWQTLRSVEIGDQIWLPFTAEDFEKLDDAVLRRAYKLDE